ncbi:polysaccharide pyruvyl transferase family protein [Chryseobacterium sp. RR2-3-20]|uniref:polysaccharide pyruvyl transferase family protein n=1 Tax=Chryseobacterium sp. RR2-3-20 TaxID=2787626 RepID=UPI001ADEF30D|nr:polysaccharide pyruvyl transferase family protein [Chryseobacterium sp. RR2-3-20]
MQKFKSRGFLSDIKNDGEKKVFIFLAADYGNLGDVAITYAQTEFLKKVLKEYRVIEIPISKTLDGICAIKKIIASGDILTTVGGGNLGDLYDQIEFYRQLVAESFPNNKIISFPQTFDFSEKPKGVKALVKAVKSYSKHDDLVFIAREKVTYDLMKKHFIKNKIILTPDIVMSLNKSTPDFERKGAVFCLRNDDEKLLKKSENDLLIDLVNRRFDDCTFYDTHINKNYLTVDERKLELEKIWNTFKKAELVITDRLHGMIFCYITNTPCLVFQNNNHKVKGSYEWIKDYSSVWLIDKFSEDQISKILSESNFFRSEFSQLEKEFKALSNELVL